MIKVFKTEEPQYAYHQRILHSVSSNYPYVMVHYLKYGDTLDCGATGFSCVAPGYYYVDFREDRLTLKKLPDIPCKIETVIPNR